MLRSTNCAGAASKRRSFAASSWRGMRVPHHRERPGSDILDQHARSAWRHEVAPRLRQHVGTVLQIAAKLDGLRSVELLDENHHAPRARGLDAVRIRLE